MMNRKETTTALAIVGLALLATITMISPTQASALGHWNVDEDFIPKSDFADNDMDSSGTSDNTDDEEEEDSTAAANPGEDSTDNSNGKEDSSHSGYEAFQDCLAEIEESPTEEEVQDCVESSYSGMDNSENTPIESTDGGNEENEADVTEQVSTDDTEEEEEDFEE
jgi:hypothetical protein